MLNDLKEKTDNYTKSEKLRMNKWEYLQRLKFFKKILKLKNMIMKLKDSLEGFKNRLD